jgi:Putative prokaryotic signal transducing protein
MPETAFVEVYRAESGIDAHLMKAALENAGIPAHVTGELVAAMEPNLGWAVPRVLVATADAAKAAIVVRDVQTAQKARSDRHVEGNSG